MSLVILFSEVRVGKEIEKLKIIIEGYTTSVHGD